MVQMTIAVPDNLAERLMSARDRLPEILELGLRQLTTIQGYSEVIDFLASGSTPQALVEFHPSLKVQERVSELLEKNRANSLTTSEQSELNQYESLDLFMTLVKARARQRLASLS